MFPPHHFSFSENSTGLHWQFSWKAPWTLNSIAEILRFCHNKPGQSWCNWLQTRILHVNRALLSYSDMGGHWREGTAYPGSPTCLHQPNPIQQVLWLKVRIFSAKPLCRRAHSARSVVPGHGLFPSAPLPSCTTIHGSSYLCTAGSWRESQARECHLAPCNSTG